MATLVAKWLNSEVRLSSEVSNVDAQFADGALLAELLRKLFPSSDVPRLEGAADRSGRLANYRSLRASLRELSISVPDKLVEQVVREERGAAATLLCRVRERHEHGAPPPPKPRPQPVAPRASDRDPEIEFFDSVRASGSLKQARMAMHIKRFEDDRWARERKQQEEAERYVRAKQDHLQVTCCGRPARVCRPRRSHCRSPARAPAPCRAFGRSSSPPCSSSVSS